MPYLVIELLRDFQEMLHVSKRALSVVSAFSQFRQIIQCASHVSISLEQGLHNTISYSNKFTTSTCVLVTENYTYIVN